MRYPRRIVLLALPFTLALAGCGASATYRAQFPSSPSPAGGDYATYPDSGLPAEDSQASAQFDGTTNRPENRGDAMPETRSASGIGSREAVHYWGTDPAASDSMFGTNVLSTQKGPNPNEPYLNLFGEIEGAGGLPGQFAATESIEQVTFASEGADFDPCIDITGEHLLYSSTQHSDTADIYIKSVDGTTVTRLTSDPADDVMPAFSPDNRYIAFSSNRSGNWDVYVMEASGGPPVQVTNDPAHEIHPSWSPDGRTLVFSRLSEQSGRWEMWVTEYANTAARKFIGYGLFPEWCPDPAVNKIVYQQARERGSRLFSIWTVDIENGEGRRPTEIASAANAAAINPTWSVDGRMIAFSTIVDPEHQNPRQPGWADVWVIGVDGSGRANLTNGEYANLQPTWGPDGRIFFISNRSGIDNVWATSPMAAIKTARGGIDPDPLRRQPGDSEMADVPTDP